MATELFRDNSDFSACLPGVTFHSTLETSRDDSGALRSIVLHIGAAIKTSDPPTCNVFTPFKISNCLLDGLDTWLLKALTCHRSIVAMQRVHYNIFQHQITLQRIRHFFGTSIP